MARLRILAHRYGAVFTHGLLAGALLALTVHSGMTSG